MRDSNRAVMKENDRKHAILYKNMLVGAMALVVERQIQILRGPEFEPHLVLFKSLFLG